jgi:DNA-binding MltR family transcriptional regulator
MYGAAVSRVREHVITLDLQPERLRRVFGTARNESDRSAAILVFALAEDLMLDAMKRYLSDDVQGGWDELVGGNGLLATANDRITLLRLLNWIHPIVYADLRLLKSIRNRFAHHAEVIGFEDQLVRNWIAAMKTSEVPAIRAVTNMEEVILRNELNARDLFLMRSCLVITRMVGNLAVAPRARLSQVAPGHVEGDSWDTCPENLKELNRIAAEMVLSVACTPPASS